MNNLSQKLFEELVEEMESACLRDVYEAEVLGKRIEKRRLNGIYRWAKKFLDLCKTEVIALSALSAMNGAEVKDICELIHLSNKPTTQLLMRMVGKGVAYWTEASSQKDITFFLAEKARRAFYGLDTFIGLTEAGLHDHIVDTAYEIRHTGEFSAERFCSEIEGVFAANPHLQFSKGYDELALSELSAEEKGLVLVYASEFISKGPVPVDSNSLTVIPEPTTDGPFIAKTVYKVSEDTLSQLVQRGLLIALQVREERTTRVMYMLSINAVAKLFKGQSQLVRATSLTQEADFWRSADIPQKSLFFSPHDEVQIQQLSALLKPAIYEEYKRRLQQGEISGMAGFLLSGPPGTGKTEVVRQLARQQGHDILVADIAKMEGEWWGESEKLYRELFRTCNYLAAVSKTPPILLFNEADAILSRRITVSSNSDKLQNTLQNILLDELEKFGGIFIATTNLVTNLDKAFERRFTFKIKLGYPTPEVAARIWTLKIRALSEEQATQLASQFCFTGGQIDNIGRRCILHEVINGVFPSEETIVDFCREEFFEKNTPIQHVIGFHNFKSTKQ